MIKGPKIDSLKLIVFLVLGCIILFIISFTFLPKYTKIKELAEEEQALSEKISQAEKEVGTLRNDIESLKDDPFYLEKVARDQLGAAKDNEVVIKIEE
ncbi:MAG: septum formation initiator family protein [Candidatus Omnitrophica bacterium]|nr:septum formation initiator family protein [Candidatus Omnitrophota bacterium]